MNPGNKRLLPWWQIVLLDILALGIALCVFSLFHHVLPKKGNGPITSIVNVGGETSAAGGTVSAITTGAPSTSGNNAGATTSAEATATASSGGSSSAGTVGDFTSTFPKGKITGDHAYAYADDKVRITIDKKSADNVTYFVADIYLSNIKYFKTAFANNTYGQGYAQEHLELAKANNAILAISGDYYGARSSGLVIRNGKLYRETLFNDVCILYADGTMETMAKEDFNLDAAIKKGAYQGWSFGPMLLKNGGETMTKDEFNNKVNPQNPRSSIGYYAPGHYCFVTVDGRQPGYSDGYTLEEMSKLYASLGCKAAYNLDGGQTVEMSFKGETVNKPYNGGRACSDIVYIGE